MQAQKQGFAEPSNCDGLLEVVAFKSGYHAGVVMAGGMHAVRLAQAAGVRMRVRGTEAAGGAKAPSGGGMGTAYIQLDGEPWKQSVPGQSAPESEALQVRMHACMAPMHTQQHAIFLAPLKNTCTVECLHTGLLYTVFGLCLLIFCRALGDPV